MNNSNKYHTPRSSRTQKTKPSQRNGSQNYENQFFNYVNYANTYQLKKSRTPGRYIDNETVDTELVASIFNTPKTRIPESQTDIKNYTYQLEQTKKKKIKPNKTQQDSTSIRLSCPKPRDTSTPPQPKPKKVNSLENNKDFINSVFIGIEKQITLKQLESILHYFSIIDQTIKEKRLVARNILPLCRIGKSKDNQLFDSEKLRETLLQSFKKAPTSSFWDEIANCIRSARMNGKKVFVMRYSTPEQNRPNKPTKKNKKIEAKSAVKPTNSHYNDVDDEQSYSSGEEASPSYQLAGLLKRSGTYKKDEKHEVIEFPDNDDNKDKQREKVTPEQDQQLIFDEEEEEQQLIFEEEQEGEEEPLVFEEKLNANINEEDEEEALQERQAGAKRNPKLIRRRKVRKHNANANAAENEGKNKNAVEEDYNEYSNSYEYVEEEELTFEDLVRESEQTPFSEQEYQSMVDEASNSTTDENFSYDSFFDDDDASPRKRKRVRTRHERRHRKGANDYSTSPRAKSKSKSNGGGSDSSQSFFSNSYSGFTSPILPKNPQTMQKEENNEIKDFIEEFSNKEEEQREKSQNSEQQEKSQNSEQQEKSQNSEQREKSQNSEQLVKSANDELINRSANDDQIDNVQRGVKSDNLALSPNNTDQFDSYNTHSTIDQIEILDNNNNAQKSEGNEKEERFDSSSSKLEMMARQIEQLRAENQQLSNENRQLKSEGSSIESLSQQVQKLKAENDQLTSDNEKLKENNRQLMNENKQLKENSSGNAFMLQENSFDSAEEEEEEVI